MVQGRPARRAALTAGIAVAAFAAAVVSAVVATKGVKSMLRNDAEFFWLVARDPFSDGAVFRPFAHEMGSAYRYGRILFPLLAWALAFGRASIVHWTQIGLDVVFFGVAAGLAVEHATRRGADPQRGLTILLVPGMWSALVLAISEPLVISLVLATYLFAIAGQRTRARASASLLLLAREAAVLALVPMVARDVRERGARSITSWALVPFPLFGWWIWVRARVGEWPFLDPSISRRQALGWPCAGAVTVIREGASATHWLAFALGALTVIGGVYVARRHRWFPLSDGALMLSLLVLFFGSNAWRYPGEAIRLLALPQALIVLCIATTPGRRMPVAPRRRLSVR